MAKSGDTGNPEPEVQVSRSSPISNGPWRQDYWESRVFNALTLIVIGVIFLGNTTGLVPWNVWLNMLKLWPLIIVSIGISIIFGGPNRWMKLVGSIITFAIFLVMVVLSLSGQFQQNWSFLPAFSSGSTQSYHQEVAYDQETNYTSQLLDIDMGLGDLKIADNNDSTNYLELDTQYANSTRRPELVVAKNNSQLEMTLTAKQQQVWFFESQTDKYDLQLGRDILPLDLRVKVGAGNGNIALDQQDLTSLNAEVGAGSLVIDLGKETIVREMRLKAGVGSIEVQVPQDWGLRLEYKVGLGSLTLDGQSLANGSGNSIYQTAGYADADQQLTVQIDVGLGSVNIVTK